MAIPPHLSVIVPAYNEAVRIGASLERMEAYFGEQPYTTEIVVVDDGSTDSTARIVSGMAGARTRLLQYGANRGKGFAVRHGMTHCDGALALFSDADLATPIEEVEKLFAAIEAGADVAIGSRDLPGSRLERRQSPIREMGGKLFNRFVQALAVPGIHDTQCGFKLFTRDASLAVFGMCLIDNFSFDVEALFIARRLGYRIAEVPVRWRHQEGSKVRLWRDAPRMVRTLFRIRTTRYPFERAATRASLTP
ncbi:MAG: glycosyltransferase family 2 protein [Armatimonadetes bacterium]|nr:glycosyltransferase family 2 protein [Armatimonadota bacterium]